MTVVLLNIIKACDWLLGIYSIVVFIACALTWVNADFRNPIVRSLRAVTEPLFWRIRKYLPFTYAGGLDFSPLVLILGIYLFRIVVLSSLASLIAPGPAFL